jgi:hypothetical protein
MRPTTLAEVARLAAEGHPFDLTLGNFLDGFKCMPQSDALAQAPMLLATSQGHPGQVQDAYLAATAEELSRQHGFPLPLWVNQEDRKLRRPWFASSMSALRAVLLLESPAGFRSRNLFVSENALSRA